MKIQNVVPSEECREFKVETEQSTMRTGANLGNPHRISEIARNPFRQRRVSLVNLEGLENFIGIYRMWTIMMLTLNASIGFFFFGYCLTVFNTMQENLTHVFGWGDQKTFYISLISALPPLGCVFGSVLSGKICSYFGRRNTFIILDIVGIISCLLSLIINTPLLTISKLIKGFVIGAFSTLVPLYIYEYVPQETTGLCGIVYNISSGIGVLTSYIMGFKLPSPEQSEDNWWRFMFAFPCIPLFINLIVLLFIFKLDTPKHLYHLKKEDQMKEALSLIHKTQKEMFQVIEIYKDDSNKEISFKDICSKRFVKRLIICILLNTFQQSTLIEPLGIFSNLIYGEYENQETSTVFTALSGLAEFIGYFLSMFIIDRLGRKTIYLIGLLFTSLTLIALSIFYFIEYYSAIVYLIIFLDFLCGLSINSVVWIYNSDVLPDLGVGICTMSNWITSTILIFIFPYLLESDLKTGGVFLVFGIITFVGTIFTTIFMKESRNKTQADLEQEFEKGCC